MNSAMTAQDLDSLSTFLVTTAWDGILAGLLANKYDTICGSMTITEKRLKVEVFIPKYVR